jgi:hypothetical protein
MVLIAMVGSRRAHVTAAVIPPGRFPNLELPPEFDPLLGELWEEPLVLRRDEAFDL